MDPPGEFLRLAGRPEEANALNGLDQRQQQNDAQGSTRTDERAARNGYMPDYLSGPLDPSRMQLSQEERQWALSVKEAIQADPELDNLSDLMCAQIALVEQGDVEKAVQRAHRLQHCRQEYGILDTCQDGQRWLSNFIQKFPGHVLHFCFCDQLRKYVFVIDLTKIGPSGLTDINDMHAAVKGLYYCHQALGLDLESVRQGVVAMIECGGYKWKSPDMCNLELFRLGLCDVSGIYPVDFDSISFCNTGVVVNMMVSMVRRFIPERMRENFFVGIQTEERLDTICMVPSVEIASERIHRAMCEALRRRYEAESIFKI